MWYRLPPVGNRISLVRGKGAARNVEILFSPYSLRLYQSGTAALAAAVIVAMARRPTTAPEVLLPAYGCPDLISAVLHAGAKPVLVDLAVNTPWLDQTQMVEKINEHTVAVIAVNFLGIEESMTGLRAIADKAGILLIEDSAQCLFESAGDPKIRGDFIVQSFGRGKPVSLLGGGAVLWRDQSFRPCLPRVEAAVESNLIGNTAAWLKILLYNILLTPHIYGLMERVPFLHIGETRFKPLKRILPASAQVISGLPTNIGRFRRNRGNAQQWIRAMLDRLCLAQIIDLTCLSTKPVQPDFLRYPLLVTDNELRKRLYSALRSAGLGVSRMYPVALPEISGLAGILGGQERCPRARAFADGILTLPTHQGVSRRHVVEMEKIIVRHCVVQAAC